MATTECNFCNKVLDEDDDEADWKLNTRRYNEYLRRYPDAGISDNLGDRPDFRVLCGTCTANQLQDEADRLKKETFLDSLAQGENHPHYARNFIIIMIMMFLVFSLLLGRK